MWLRNGLEPWHLLIVVVVFVLLFGSKKLPAAAKGVAQSLKIFRNEIKPEDPAQTAQTAQAAVAARVGTAQVTSTAAVPGTVAQAGGQVDKPTE